MELKRKSKLDEQTQKFRSYQKRSQKKESTIPVKDVPFYNWLEQ